MKFTVHQVFPLFLALLFVSSSTCAAKTVQSQPLFRSNHSNFSNGSVWPDRGAASVFPYRFSRLAKGCIPEVLPSLASTSTEDHYSHAVAGTYPAGGSSSFVDRLGLGYYTVNIDGTGSHTHFAIKGYTAKIKSYVWTREDTGKVISTNAKFSYKFPLGTTILKLRVIDTVCSEHEDTTSITVTGKIQTGAICYLYNDPGKLLNGNTLKGFPRPAKAFVSKSLNIKISDRSFNKKKFFVRCIFLVRFSRPNRNTKVSVLTSSTGIARLYRGTNLVYDSSNPASNKPIRAGKGLEEFEVTFRYTKLGKAPVLSITSSGSPISGVYYDIAKTLPIISSISPSTGSTSGGTEVRIYGYNFYRPLTIHFGNAIASIKKEPALYNEVTAIAPAKKGSAKTSVTVRTGQNYISNSVSYSYGNTCDDIKFDTGFLKTASGKKVVVSQPTAVTMGHDGNLYVATLEGRIHKINYDHETTIVKSTCYSEIFKDNKWKNKAGKIAPRAFLGIALDPRDKVPRPYVSASTLHQHRKDIPISKSNPYAWSNGAVERFKPSSATIRKSNPQQCLQHDKNIVQGLPVANGDHSVNQILFSQSGDLLIAVGGRTNMGLPQIRLGGSWETYFSGAILVAKLSKPSFKGTIPYTTPRNLRTARPKDGYKDVDLYATGFRNPFAMTMSRAGNIYAADNGPNKGFGDASSKCSEYNEAEAAKGPAVKNVAGGGAILGTGEFKYTASRPDKIMWVKQGKFYGHPNLQRSAILGVNECAYIDPLTGKTPPPGKKMPPANYEHRLAMQVSASTGILEYGGNEFCGKLRGNLFISKPRTSGTYTMTMNSNGKNSGQPYKFSSFGGLTVVEDSTGSLIFPKFAAEPTNGFFVLKPRISNRNELYIGGAVPFRHGKKGGNAIHIAGRGFSTSSIVTIGGKICQPVSRTSKKIVCKVPSHSGGSLSVDVIVRTGSKSAILKRAVLYMQV